MKVALVADEFPQASVAEKTTVAAPVAPHRLESAVKLCDQVMPEQLSVADAPA